MHNINENEYDFGSNMNVFIYAINYKSEGELYKAFKKTHCMNYKNEGEHQNKFFSSETPHIYNQNPLS